MRFYVGVTDDSWFQFLSSRPDIDEVNFWQPGGLHRLRQIEQGALFLFKLHGRDGPIAGGGYFSYQTEFPLSVVWRYFGEKNGTSSLADFIRLVSRRRRTPPNVGEIPRVGCIMLTQPFFFGKDERVSGIPGWHPNTQPGRYYDTDEPEGRRLHEQVMMSLRGIPTAVFEEPVEPEARYGRRRLRDGPAIFRSRVTDAYGRRCAVTRERVLPVLEAAHIKPYALAGPNVVQNGLLLRADIHKLFDDGYATVRGEPGGYRFAVSRKIKAEFDNGQQYLDLDTRPLARPQSSIEYPSPEFIAWHNAKFKG
jgi:putative restriction endonuclease